MIGDDFIGIVFFICQDEGYLEMRDKIFSLEKGEVKVKSEFIFYLKNTIDKIKIRVII